MPYEPVKLPGNEDPRREYWRREYPGRWPRKRDDHKLSTELLDQLDRCQSPEAQRIILGVSK